MSFQSDHSSENIGRVQGCRYKPKPPNPQETHHPIYEFLTPLRCVLIKWLRPDNWGVLQQMERHAQERKLADPDVYAANKINVVSFIQREVLTDDGQGEQLFNGERIPDDGHVDEVERLTVHDRLASEPGQISASPQTADDDDIWSALDVLDVNAFEVRGLDFSIRGLYPLTAMMNSSCTPNTQNCIADDLTCRVRAARDIKKVQKQQRKDS